MEDEPAQDDKDEDKMHENSVDEKIVNSSLDPANILTLRELAVHNSLWLFVMNLWSTLLVCMFYLTSWETVASCSLGVSLTAYLYYATEDNSTWDGGGLSWTLLSFAVITPMTSSIRMAFSRREAALKAIATLRATSYQLYVAHTAWDWRKHAQEPSGRAAVQDVSWLRHSDQVLKTILQIATELSQFLTLPCISRARHRVTTQGKHESNQLSNLSKQILSSIITRHLNTLTNYCEDLKQCGMPANEASRIRQWERSMLEQIETLRNIKAYRTPQALRSFARLFTIVLPGFYSPFYAQIAKDIQSLPFGIIFAALTSIALTALFESVRVLEDPFVAHITLDGIDVVEEFDTMFKMQLVDARHFFFPDAESLGCNDVDRTAPHVAASNSNNDKKKS